MSIVSFDSLLFITERIIMSDHKEKFLRDMTQDENVYLMGLLWADGYVGKKYEIGLEMKSSDFEYIQPLLNIYGFTVFGKRQRYKKNMKFGNVQKNFRISNISLNSHLQQLEYRSKSFISPQKVLSTIPNDKHYLWWRGFFDGDACFYCRGALHVFAVWGSINQDWSELKKLFSRLDIQSFRFKKYSRKNGQHLSSCISIGAQDDIEKVGRYIYQNRMDIGFCRKYDKYLKCITTPSPLFKKKTSTKRGVYFSIWTGKWICRKFVNKKRIVVGSFDDYQKACDAYDTFSNND